MGYSVPYQVPNDPEQIIARDDLMQQINSIFNPCPQKGSVSFRFVHLWGRSGSGKTTLAKHYIQLHQSDISFVFWVWAESWETAAGSYLDFANNLVAHYSSKMPLDEVEERLGLTGVADMVCAKSILHLDKNRVMSVVRAVKDWLMQPENDKWLVVFDGVEPIYNVQEFIPLTLSGRVILTSKSERACTWGSKVLVHSMSEEEALELLSLDTGHLTSENGTQGTSTTIFSIISVPQFRRATANITAVASAKDLVKRLECHPQSIVQAASAIHVKNILVSDYELQLATSLSPRVFGSTIDQSPAARLILRISALLSLSAVPASLFLRTFQNVKSSPPRFSKAVAELKSESIQTHHELYILTAKKRSKRKTI